MIKRLLLYTAIATLVFSITYNVHSYIINTLEVYHTFNLISVYLFQSIASLFLVVIFEFLTSFTSQFKDQLGFLYLGSMAAKLMFFCIIFRDVLFVNVVLTRADSISLLIPILIFLFYEVFFIVKILNRST